MTATRHDGTAGGHAGFDSGISEALVRTSRFFRKGEVSSDLRSLHQIGGRDADSFYRDRWAHDKVVRSTHGVNCTGSCSWKVYVKDGIITWEAQQTDYPTTGARPSRVRAARLPARRRLLLVHLLADPRALPLRARLAAADVPRGQGSGSVTRCSRGPTSSTTPRRRRTYKSQRGKGGLVRVDLGRGDRDDRRRARAHDQEVRAGPDRRVLADPGHVDGVARRRGPVHVADRRPDAVVLRLVRRPAGRLTAGVRRPDRRAGVRRLVGRRVPDPVGLERPGDPHPGRALDDRGPLPGPEGRRDEPRLLRRDQVRRRLAGRRTRAPTAPWRWPWATSSSRSSSSTGRCPASTST